MPDARTELREALGADLPAGLDTLGDDQLRDLAGVIASARRNQAKALAEAGENALRHVPAPLRRIVRKIAGG